MDLDFSEEQQMIVDMTRGLLEEYCDLRSVAARLRTLFLAPVVTSPIP